MDKIVSWMGLKTQQYGIIQFYYFPKDQSSQLKNIQFPDRFSEGLLVSYHSFVKSKFAVISRIIFCLTHQKWQ